mgnify:CR=1 FL=1
MNYINLGIVLDYTLLTSLVKIDDLISFANKNNIKVLGILNDNLYSTMEFYTKCINNNIKPIIGLIKVMDNLEYYLYPKKYDGLVDLFNERFYTNNIICVIPNKSKKLYDNINIKDKYISYVNKDELSDSLKITDKVVSINKVYSIDKENAKYVNYLHLIDKGLTISNYNFQNYDNNYFNSVYDTFDIDTTIDFSKLINIDINIYEKYIPKYCDNSYEFLKNLCNKGLYKRLNNNVSDIYKKRLEYELNVINTMGYVDYFLIVYDYVKYAKRNDIMVGPGRGSAAGSLVSYTLGITEIDPIKYDLLFERFLNPERVTMPDIDIDFDATKRYKVIQYVIDKYGREKVSNIMTYSTLSSKQVLRDVSKCLEIDNRIVDRLCNYIEAKKCLRDNLNNNVKKMLEQYSNLKNAYYVSIKLEGLKRQIGTHAAGVVISSENLTNLVPMIKDENIYLTGYTMEYLERLGLLKMDFLAIKDLTILDNIIKSVEGKIGRKINIHAIPLNDKKTYIEFSKGNTSGVFQFESSGMKNFLRKLNPNNFSDLIAAIAIFRPGPMANIDSYIARKNGKEIIDYISDDLKSILESTYGIIIYQEQIMQILSIMANYSFAEADLIRRAISKKKLDIIEEEKTKFISKSMSNGYSEEIANRVYDLIVRFANYGFNKSHSVAYALVGYEMCFLKTHYPVYFYEALLNYNIGSEIKTKEYLNCLKRLNVKISKPDVNLSSSQYIVVDDKILLPFNIIKNIGTSVSDLIVNARGDGFKDYFDFVKKVNCCGIGEKTIELLIMAGTLDSFGLNRHTMVENLNNAIDYSDLASGMDNTFVSVPNIDFYEEYDKEKILNNEKEVYGFYLSDHPIVKFNNNMKLIDIGGYFDKSVKIYLLIDEMMKIKTKDDADMAFLVCSDETDNVDLIVFPNKFNLISDIKVGDIVNVYGRVEKRYDKYQILVNDIKKVNI